MKKRTVFLLCMAVAMSGCVAYHPHPMAAKDLLSRAKVQENAEVRVAAYVPGPEEARDLFGADLDKYDVQPVWLRIENKSNQTIFFIHRSLDPDYFTPEEAARRSRLRVFRHGRLLSIPSIVALPVNIPLTVFANRNMRSEFAREGLRDVVLAPGEVISGYVFTHFDQGTKSVKVGYLGDQGEDEVHFFAEIPGIRQDYKDTVSEKIFRPEEIKEVDAGELQRRLEAMPCCVTNKKGDRNGDPLNLVVIGDLPVILNAFAMAGWDETETLSFRTAMKTFKAFLMGKDYSY
ncbi:MAG: LssY C-terminal domain-containing protein, partial [Candidatus Omnitrophota bacterium]